MNEFGHVQNKSLPDLPIDSKEGISLLMQWARQTGAVLTPAHIGIARRYGVETDGVLVSRPLPTGYSE